MYMNTIILGIKFIITFTNQFEIIAMGLHVILNIVPSFNWPFFNPYSHAVGNGIIILKIYKKSIKKVQCNTS